jgi:ribonuclease R
VTRDELLRAFAARVPHPVSARECLQLLQVPREERVGVRRQLRALAGDGSLVLVRGRQYALPGKMDVVVGRLIAHPDGFGFVRPEVPAPGDTGDIFIPAARMIDAMHGDRVAARVEPQRRDGRREGRLVRILDRANATLVGRFAVDGAGRAWVVPHERRVLVDVVIPDGERGGARAGDMVVAEVTRWPTATRGPVGRVAEVLGQPDAPGVDTLVVIRKHGLPDAHGPAALAEAASLGTAVREADLAGRTDFRAWPIVTIDGDAARDFDDAISLERLPNGRWWLGVHIADVAHYVTPGSALDDEALERGTSVYFPNRAIHMLPADLAAHLCSLKPGEDRLVQSCLMEVDDDGTVVRYEVHDGVIRSSARMTYGEVNAILTDREPAVLAKYDRLLPLVEEMRALFERLLARRRRRGAIDFDLPQPEIVLDAEGLVEAIVPAERNIAHRLIEEFMLLANETVASHVDRHGYPSLYRVHDAPDPFKVESFASFVACLGFRFEPSAGGVRPRDFQRLVEQIRGAPMEKPVAFLMLRTMQLARYEAVNRGHFGLALETYTHFTSPIRRYPDLVVHRLLRQARHGRLDGPRPDGEFERLADVASRASERERRAMEAERELVQWKKARFMAGKIGDEFDGVVTGVTSFGLFVELAEHFVEGLVHVSTLADDVYRFVETDLQLRGEYTRRVFRMGDRVRVQVAAVDPERRQIELALVEVLEHIRVQRVSPPTLGASRTDRKATRAKAGAKAGRSQRPARGAGRVRSRRKR